MLDHFLDIHRFILDYQSKKIDFFLRISEKKKKFPFQGNTVRKRVAKRVTQGLPLSPLKDKPNPN